MLESLEITGKENSTILYAWRNLERENELITQAFAYTKQHAILKDKLEDTMQLFLLRVLLQEPKSVIRHNKYGKTEELETLFSLTLPDSQRDHS